MIAKIVILVCALSVVFAYPYPYPEEDNFQPELEPYAAQIELEQPAPLQRLKRQFNLQGGGSPGKGIDLSVGARVPVWQSHNGRHSFDATGSYSQHLGGPYGNSPPNWGAGGVYTFRF